MEGTKHPGPSTAAYTVGFLLSMLLTLAAYFIVAENMLLGRARLLAIAGLAVAQLYVQLIFFLHLAQEKHPRWNIRVFGFMLLIVVIVVAGSLWIMDNLNYHMSSPEETDESIIQDEGIYR